MRFISPPWRQWRFSRIWVTFGTEKRAMSRWVWQWPARCFGCLLLAVRVRKNAWWWAINGSQATKRDYWRNWKPSMPAFCVREENRLAVLSWCRPKNKLNVFALPGMILYHLAWARRKYAFAVNPSDCCCAHLNGRLFCRPFLDAGVSF